MEALPMAFLVCALGLFRVARMLAFEEGPYSLFARIRGSVDPHQRTWLGRGLNCPLCVGFWLAWIFALALPWQNLGDYALLALGLAGAAALIQGVSG